MKKLLIGAGLACLGAMAACNGTNSNTASNADSAKADSLINEATSAVSAAADSAKSKIDSTLHVAADSLQSAVDTLKKKIGK